MTWTLFYFDLCLFCILYICRCFVVLAASMFVQAGVTGNVYLVYRENSTGMRFHFKTPDIINLSRLVGNKER